MENYNKRIKEIFTSCKFPDSWNNDLCNSITNNFNSITLAFEEYNKFGTFIMIDPHYNEKDNCNKCKNIICQPILMWTDNKFVAVCETCFDDSTTNKIKNPIIGRHLDFYLVTCQQCYKQCTIGNQLQNLFQHMMNDCAFLCNLPDCKETSTVTTIKNHFKECSNKKIDCPWSVQCKEYEHKYKQSLPVTCNFNGICTDLNNHLQSSFCSKMSSMYQFLLVQQQKNNQQETQQET